jgi:hypothetical protein
MPEAENAEEMFWSLSEVVKKTGLSTGQVQQAVKEGFLAVTVKGKYNPAATLLGLIKFLAKRVGTLPTYDSMAQCAAETGIPLGVIKQVRRTSRQAFRNTRISLQALLKEIFTAKKEMDYQALETKCTALLAQIELEKAQGLKLDKNEVRVAIRRAVSEFWFAYDRAAELELPPLLKGCDEDAIRRHLVETGGKMKATINAQLAKYAAAGNGEHKPKSPKTDP